MNNKYEQSGVSTKDAERFVNEIKTLTKGQNTKDLIGGIGGFGALFALDKNQYVNPVLVSSTDGVGTKILIARDTKIFNTIGIDLVAMCINDIICHGAKPLFFLDYFASSKLDIGDAKEIIKGIVAGCNEVNIPLVGGETAEMPGLYRESDFDLAGFALGIVEHDSILPKKNIEPNDVVIGIKSTGLHSNGFSLIRKMFHDLNINYTDDSIFIGKKWYEVLLEPTKIYKEVLGNLDKIKALAHITGGGIIENFAPRVLPSGLKFDMSYQEQDWPDLFKWIKQEGMISYEEMLQTFNCGLGMVLVAKKEDENLLLANLGKSAIKIGRIMQ